MKPIIKQLGDAALLVEFEQKIDQDINRRVLELRDRLNAQNQFAIEFLTPAFCSLTIGFDSLAVSREKLTAYVQELAKDLDGDLRSDAKTVRIPVCYDLEFGLDLADVAQQLNQSTGDVIQTHQQPTYHAYMLGFLPGFAYLGSVDASIQVSRKSNPRTSVPAGSVGLAGQQTGVYPAAAPGGWQIIGRTPVSMFDPNRRKTFLVEPGDQVKFFSIGREQFDAMLHEESKSCRD